MSVLDRLSEFVLVALLLVGCGQTAPGQIERRQAGQIGGSESSGDIDLFSEPYVHFTDRLAAPFHRIAGEPEEIWTAPTEVQRPIDVSGSSADSRAFDE